MCMAMAQWPPHLKVLHKPPLHCLRKAICVHQGWHLLAVWLGAWNIHLFSYDRATWDRRLHQHDIKQSPSRLDDSSPQWKLSSAHIPCPPTPPAHHKATRAFLWQGGGGESEETGPVAFACPHNFIVTQLICLRGVQKSEDTCSLLYGERKKRFLEMSLLKWYNNTAGILWLTPAWNAFVQFLLQVPEYVAVGTGGGRGNQILNSSPSQAGRTKTSSHGANIPWPKGIL